MTKRDIRRYTVTQLLVMLDRSDPSDPHAGQIPLDSLEDLDDLI